MTKANRETEISHIATKIIEAQIEERMWKIKPKTTKKVRKNAKTTKNTQKTALLSPKKGIWKIWSVSKFVINLQASITSSAQIRKVANTYKNR